MAEVTEKTCLWCGVTFERKRARAALCPGCRTEKKREYDRRFHAEREEAKQVILSRVLDVLAPELHPLVRKLADEYLDTRDDPRNVPMSLILEHATTAAGPDEGSSPFSKELRGELATLVVRSLADPWWSENPAEDVFFQLGEIEDAKAYFAELAARREAEPTACGEAKGSVRGAGRHSRAGEPLCYECSAAKLAYQREYYAKSKTA